MAREYAALDAAAKARFRENVKLATELGGGSDADAFVTLFGEKAGSETIAGQIAKKVTLNGTIPAASGVLPKGVRWKKTEPKDADFITHVWALKHQSSDPSKVPPATMAKDAVRYLASAQAGAELREMGAGQGQGEETGEAESDTTGQ